MGSRQVARPVRPGRAAGRARRGIRPAARDPHCQLDDWALAERELNEALDYYRQNAMRPYLARSLQLLARLEAHALPLEATPD